jgi:hypothetical protein
MSEEEYGKYSPPPTPYIEVIDTSKTRANDKHDLLKIIRKYGKHGILSLFKEAIEDFEKEEKILIEQKTKREVEGQKQEIERHKIDTSFPIAFNVYAKQPERSLEILKWNSLEEIQAYHQKIVENPLRFSSIFHGNPSYAISILEWLIQKKRAEPPKNKNLIEKVKDKLSQYAT